LKFIKGNYAVVEMSSVRKNKTFSGLALDENLIAANTQPRCNIQIINLATDAAEHWVRLEDIIEKFYDVKILAQTKKILLTCTQKEDIRTMIPIE